MARRVFFSFHYKRDLWRVNIVRNAWQLHGHGEVGVWDASLWETVKREGDDAIRRLIEAGLKNTSTTAVLIGPQTHKRRWVKYEIQRSYERGNALLGIYIHNIKDQSQHVDPLGKGPNPFLSIKRDTVGNAIDLSFVPTYDWVLNNGRRNMASWVEDAIRRQ